MLGRGEKRALLFMATILLLSLLIRFTAQLMPGSAPPGTEVFIREGREIMAALERRDSLVSVREHRDSTGNTPDVGGNSQHPPVPGHREQEPIDINRADSAQLLPLPGIGPVFSGRIIKYRDLLGGFVSTEQLGEVYGLDPETIEEIKGSILVDTAGIRRLSLNGSAFSNLLRHPYLEYADVKALMRYRDLNGKIGSAGEIRDNHLLNDSTLDRVIPYLDFDR